jgi:hypothetical protein
VSLMPGWETLPDFVSKKKSQQAINLIILGVKGEKYKGLVLKCLVWQRKVVVCYLEF